MNLNIKDKTLKENVAVRPKDESADALMVVEGCVSALDVPLLDRELLLWSGRAVEEFSHLCYHRDS